MNNKHFNLIIFIIFLLLANLLLFYFIIGHSVLIYFCFILFFLIVIISILFFIRSTGRPRPPFIVKQENAIEQEALTQEMQTTPVKILQNNSFSIHKIVIFIEIIIIIILALNLILKH